MKITWKELHDVLWYCNTNGNFYWRYGPSRSVEPWSLAGHKKKCGRVNIKINGIPHLAHRLAWLYVHKEWPQKFLDHINGDPSDNRIENLRDVSNSINMQNQKRAHSGSRSGILGVQKRGEKYAARITVNNTPVFLGLFESKEAASQAYINAKRQMHEGNTL